MLKATDVERRKVNKFKQKKKKKTRKGRDVCVRVNFVCGRISNTRCAKPTRAVNRLRKRVCKSSLDTQQKLFDRR